MPSSERRIFTPRLASRARTIVSDRETSLDLSILAAHSCLGGAARGLAGRSLLVATQTQRSSALALVELDGIARRLVIAPPDLNTEDLASVAVDAEVDGIVTDEADRYAGLSSLPTTLIEAPRADASWRPGYTFDTEWALFTSGTTGRPKIVVHTLAGLTGAIAPAAKRDVWSTFYDIRRYGGLQIFLRALLGGCDLVLSDPAEAIGDHLDRLGAAGVTAISGTPSHWRRVLMSGRREALRPNYIRLSGEAADQLVLDGLRQAYPDAAIGHAYASTEAGVAFAVDDGREGFPAGLVDQPGAEVEMRIVDGSLRIRSARTALRYLGPDRPALLDEDGFVETGDLVERRGDRFVFLGRRGGIINVGGLKVNPEEVEAALNAHAAVRMSLVRARKNPLTGAIVVADVVLEQPETGDEALKADILADCRGRLAPHKVPVFLTFVPALALTPGGKLSRAHG